MNATEITLLIFAGNHSFFLTFAWTQGHGKFVRVDALSTKSTPSPEPEKALKGFTKSVIQCVSV